MKNNILEQIEEEIGMLQVFLESDLYSKFRPEERLKIKGKVQKFYRVDSFKNEKELMEYLNAHFDILRKEIRRIIKK